MKIKSDSLNEQSSIACGIICKLVGDLINYTRNEKKISIRELCRRTGISIAVISDLENGKKFPRLDIVIKLILALDIPLDFIFSKKILGNLELNQVSKPAGIKERPHNNLIEVLRTYGLNKEQIKEQINYVSFLLSKNKQL